MQRMLSAPQANPIQKIVLIDDGDKLVRALDRLAASAFVAIDTEFMRESTYFARLCLLQLATLDECAIVDPLAQIDLEPLWRFLADRSRMKVLHAARQDLEVLARFNEPLPGPIFDTQVAAALLGHPAQIGYGNLVSALLSHTLSKGQTRTDWTRRPLSAEQIEYAADDVRYLAPLYVRLRDELQLAGRLSWLEEEAQEMESPQLYRTEPALAWRRLKGLERLRPEQRAVAKRLAEWREELAIRVDKPRGWILADDSLREIAERLPKDPQALSTIRSLPPAVLRKRGNEILAIVHQGMAAADTQSDTVDVFRPNPEQLALASRLLAVVRARAEQLRISPELLATRRDVEQLAFFGRSEHLCSGWRRELIGEPLVALAGQSLATSTAR